MTEEMFDRLSKEKQERMMIDLFRKIEDKGYLYGFACNVFEREERERNEGKRDGGSIIDIKTGRRITICNEGREEKELIKQK